MTNNTQFKTLVNTWLNQKKPMITPSTHASFTLIAENHLIPYFGKRKIGSITEADIQSYISYLYNAGRLDKTGGLTVKTIRDVILVLRLSMEYAYKERAIPLLNWDLIEYPKELGIKKVVSLSKDQEQALIQCIYMDLNRKTAGILIALFTGVRIGELCGLQMRDISLTDKTISINKTVQRIYDKKKGESYLHIGPPKTKTSARTIPVPSLLMNIIKKFYTENPNHYFLTGKTKPTEPRTYRQFFTRFLKRNGLEKVKFHEIRHTFAVRAIEIPEFDIKSLSEILGHKNVSSSRFDTRCSVPAVRFSSTAPSRVIRMTTLSRALSSGSFAIRFHLQSACRQARCIQGSALRPQNAAPSARQPCRLCRSP